MYRIFNEDSFEYKRFVTNNYTYFSYNSFASNLMCWFFLLHTPSYAGSLSLFIFIRLYIVYPSLADSIRHYPSRPISSFNHLPSLSVSFHLTAFFRLYPSLSVSKPSSVYIRSIPSHSLFPSLSDSIRPFSSLY